MKRLLILLVWLATVTPALAGAGPGYGGGAPNVSNATGTLPIANGGTGTTYHEPNRALLGNAVSAFITPYVVEGRTMTALTGATTINAASVYTIVYCDTTAGTFTLTLRTADNFDVGKMFIIRNVGTNDLSVANTDTGTVTLAAGGFMMVHRRTGDNWTVVMKGSST